MEEQIMKEAINFSKKGVEEKVQDLVGLGFKATKATITFPGVIPNEDDYAGLWEVTERFIIVRIPFGANVKETVMKLIQCGNFEIHVEDHDDYFGKVMERDNLEKIAKSNPKYEDFYEAVFSELYSQGLRVYVQKYGLSEEEAYEMQENGACVNEQGINDEAFGEIMGDGKNREIYLEDE